MPPESTFAWDDFRLSVLDLLRQEIGGGVDVPNPSAAMALEHITQGLVYYWQQKLEGDPDAERNLLYLRSQARLLATTWKVQSARVAAKKTEELLLQVARIGIALLSSL